MRAMRLLILAALVTAIGCGTGRFGSRTRAILAGATRVEVFRVDPTKQKKAENWIGGFPVTARAQEQGKEFAGRLGTALLDTWAFSDQKGKKNCFDPGVGFRVWKDEESVDVLICFICDILYCGPSVEEASENATFKGSSRRADLLRLAKEAFPDDKEIQELKDR